MLTVLAVGDIVGPGGLACLEAKLGPLRRRYGVDFCVVNGENANMIGVTPRQCDSILRAGADAITLGNHTWNRRELYPYLDENRFVLRPANFTSLCPGVGWRIFDTALGPVLVINLIGRYMLDSNTDNPFQTVERILRQNANKARVVLVDFHAEATSEKGAMGWFLNGRVSAVWGTHTHVQTADAQILDGGTGYITDLGMTGPIRSVLGIRPDQSINKFLGGTPQRFEAADGPCKLDGCIFRIDTKTGKCREIEAVSIT